MDWDDWNELVGAKPSKGTKATRVKPTASSTRPRRVKPTASSTRPRSRSQTEAVEPAVQPLLALTKPDSWGEYNAQFEKPPFVKVISSDGRQSRAAVWGEGSEWRVVLYHQYGGGMGARQRALRGKWKETGSSTFKTKAQAENGLRHLVDCARRTKAGFLIDCLP